MGAEVLALWFTGGGGIGRGIVTIGSEGGAANGGSRQDDIGDQIQHTLSTAFDWNSVSSQPLSANSSGDETDDLLVLVTMPKILFY